MDASGSRRRRVHTRSPFWTPGSQAGEHSHRHENNDITLTGFGLCCPVRSGQSRGTKFLFRSRLWRVRLWFSARRPTLLRRSSCESRTPLQSRRVVGYYGILSVYQRNMSPLFQGPRCNRLPHAHWNASIRHGSNERASPNRIADTWCRCRRRLALHAA